MGLTDISIRRPLFISMVLLAFVVLGSVAYTRLGVEQYPKADSPYVLVLIPYPGAGPDEVESGITKTVENAVGGVAGLKNLASYSMEGLSVVALELGLGNNIDTAAIDVERKVAAIKTQLPDEAKAPTVVKAELSSLPVMTVSLSGTGLEEQLRRLADEKVKNRLEAVRGVASVTVVGGREREIQVKVDQSKLQARGISLQQLVGVLEQSNLSMPSGSVEEQGTRYNVRYNALFQRPEELRDIVIASTLGGTVYLGDVAEVVDGFKKQETLSRTNGADSVVLLVTKASGANTVEVADALRKTLKEVAKTLPPGVQLAVANDASLFVKQSVDGVQESLLDAILLTGLVLLLFLHTFRSTIIVLLAIPTSLISTFLAMWVMGFTLNTMSMMAMALSVGILVDDSIVVLENISRHLKLGETPWRAALKGRSEIGFAAVAITLVDVVVYVPIAFMSGLVGQFFREFGLTVAAATLFSLFVSFTLTPMLASKWLRGEAEREHNSLMARFGRRWEGGYDRLTWAYRRLLVWALDHRKLVVTMAAVAFFGGVALVPLRLVGTELLPSEDQGEVNLLAEMAPGATLSVTNDAVLQLEARLARMPEVTSYFSTVGSGGSATVGSDALASNQSRYARITVKLTEKGRRGKSIQQMAGELRGLGNDIPDLTLRTQVPFMGMNHGQPFVVRVKGDDPAVLRKLGAEVAEVVRRIPGAVEVSNSAASGPPEARFRADPRRLADLGLVSSAVATSLRANLEGLVIGQLRPEGQDRVDIRVVGSNTDKSTVATLSGLPLASPKGIVARLDQAATPHFVEGPVQIDRMNKQRVVTVGANVAGRPLGDVVRDFQRDMERLQLPPGYSVTMGGNVEEMDESFTALGGAILLSVALIYMLMVALYESLLYPVVIMFALPVSVVGAIGGLFLSGQTLNISSMIGMIMLTGLVGKNGILLVDYTNTLRRQGKSRFDALVEAGPTRLRPILMTTAAMVMAMIPVAFLAGQGSEIRSPMAVAVIGGLTSSTLLTLVLIPVVYTLFDDLQQRLGASQSAGREKSTIGYQLPAPAISYQQTRPTADR